MARRVLVLLSFSIALVAFSLGPAGPAQAASIVVTTASDQLDGAAPCSLREALISANTDTAVGGCPAGSGHDVIDLKAELYRLTLEGDFEDASTTGDLDITEDATIRGRGASRTVIQAAFAEEDDRVFEVHISTDVAHVLNVTIRDGRFGFGGGILVNGAGPTLHLSDSVVLNNFGTSGGGLFNNATAILRDVTFVDNESGNSGDGGAIYAGGPQTVLRNVTITGNSTEGSGGGVAVGSFNSLTLNNVTIDGNEADSDGVNGGDGGGVAAFPNATVTTSNSIIAENQDQSPVLADKAPDCDGSVTSAGHNVVGIADGCGFAAGVGDQTGTFGNPLDPGNGALGNNGGPTPTIPLLVGSPAVDRGAPTGGAGGAACESLDQRGVPRSLDQPCDVGAYELVTCFGRPVKIIGTDARETIFGTHGNDVIHSLGANDLVFAGAGDDFVCGGTGNDDLRGEHGNDSIDGQEHTDTCIGGVGRNRFLNCENVLNP